MMINKRLIGTVPESKKYIAFNVIFQWVSLAANICMIISITSLLQKLYINHADTGTFIITATAVIAAIVIRFVCTLRSADMSLMSSKAVKKTLREMIYKKLLRLGISYKEQISTSETVQIAVEGVDQLETYFGSYLPQFFYSMLAPLTLFTVLCFISVPSAVLLFVCVPLIPITIAGVQTFAKKLLSKYWGQYTALGDTFLENLQGLTTLKIYQTDGIRHDEMNRESEKFRRITMKVLTMQLNSVTVMDVIAYSGAALGVIMAAVQYRSGAVTVSGGLSIILLSADFFIPMRILGSYFHIAMNGMAASDKIFRLLDLTEAVREGTREFPRNGDIVCENLSFSYDSDREILHNISLSFPHGSYTAIVGESGSGKSTVASILTGRNRAFYGDGDGDGNLSVGGIPLSEITEESLMKNITYVGFDSYLFKGSVRENLLMGNSEADDEKVWSVLQSVNMSDFLKSEDGLDTQLLEKGSNFSGGQRQRLAIARAVLHDSPVYIFDEATSNVDVESENEIMTQIHKLAETKTVILITHRLANAEKADKIYVMQDGITAERGSHSELMNKNGIYAQLWSVQNNMEHYGEKNI